MLARGQANQCPTADLFSDDDAGMGPKNVALKISGACSSSIKFRTSILEDYRLMSVVCCFTTH